MGCACYNHNFIAGAHVNFIAAKEYFMHSQSRLSSQGITDCFNKLISLKASKSAHTGPVFTPVGIIESIYSDSFTGRRGVDKLVGANIDAHM